MASSTRIAAVLGAGPGLGGAVAYAFARTGYHVIVMTRTAESAAPTLERVRASSLSAEWRQCDSTDAASLDQAFAGTAPDVLVYNVSEAPRRQGILEMDPKELTRGLEVNATGLLMAAQRVLPGMAARGSGTVLVTGATASFRGGELFGGIAACKFAVRALTQSMAREFAPRGVHVCHVRIDAVIDSPKVKEWFGDRYNADSLAWPDDLAQTYVWLAEQPRHGWTNETELRPYLEKWTL